MTIKELINTTKIPKQEAKTLLVFLLNTTNTSLILRQDEKLDKKIIKKFKKMENLRIKGIPLQYITKTTNFLGLDLYVNKNVLIPRPETEYLTKMLSDYTKDKELNVLEIGCGSGAISLALKKENKNLKITTTEISKKAIKVAKKNKKKTNLDITIINTDIAKKVKGKFNVLVSNPPYIKKTSTTVEDQVKKYEPHLALFAEDNGLYFYKRILSETKDLLTKENLIAFEIGENQAKDIKEIAKKIYPESKITIKKDLNGYERYIFIKNNE